jgi:hypothetical protein
MTPLLPLRCGAAAAAAVAAQSEHVRESVRQGGQQPPAATPRRFALLVAIAYGMLVGALQAHALGSLRVLLGDALAGGRGDRLALRRQRRHPLLRLSSLHEGPVSFST